MFLLEDEIRKRTMCRAHMGDEPSTLAALVHTFKCLSEVEYVLVTHRFNILLDLFSDCGDFSFLAQEESRPSTVFLHLEQRGVGFVHVGFIICENMYISNTKTGL